MKYIIIICVLISFVFSSDIVGGENCDISQYPWQTSLSVSVVMVITTHVELQLMSIGLLRLPTARRVSNKS